MKKEKNSRNFTKALPGLNGLKYEKTLFQKRQQISILYPQRNFPYGGNRLQSKIQEYLEKINLLLENRDQDRAKLQEMRFVENNLVDIRQDCTTFLRSFATRISKM